MTWMNEKTDEQKRKDRAFEYLFAGNATFTLATTKLNARFTYKIAHKKNDQCENRYLIYRMFGPDNERDYRYLGLIYKDTLFNSMINSEAQSLPQKMIRAFIKIISTDTPWPETCKFYMSGKCACCGRKLTTPESIKRGIGPECYERVHGHAPEDSEEV